MAQQEIRQVESAGLRLGERRERAGCREEFIAVRAGDAQDAFFAQHRVEFAARAAVAVGDENLRILRAMGANLFAHRGSDAFWAVVQLWRQADDIERSPAIGTAQ